MASLLFKLTGQRLRSKDDIYKYAKDNRILYDWSNELGRIVTERQYGADTKRDWHWSPRSTWLSEYKEALQIVLVKRKSLRT